MAEVIYKETVESLKQCVVADIEEVPVLGCRKKMGHWMDSQKCPKFSRWCLFFQNRKIKNVVFGIGIFQRGHSVLFVCCCFSNKNGGNLKRLKVEKMVVSLILRIGFV